MNHFNLCSTCWYCSNYQLNDQIMSQFTLDMYSRFAQDIFVSVHLDLHSISNSRLHLFILDTCCIWYQHLVSKDHIWAHPSIVYTRIYHNNHPRWSSHAPFINLAPTFSWAFRVSYSYAQSSVSLAAVSDIFIRYHFLFIVALVAKNPNHLSYLERSLRTT